MTLLLLAIAATWFAWRRARRHAGLERARTAALAEPRWRYRLARERAPGSAWSGYAVLTADGAAVHEASLRWAEHGLQVVDVAPDPVTSGGGSAGSLEPGAGIRLLTRHDAGTVEIDVCDEDETWRVATITGTLARELADRLDAGELTDCVVLRQAAGRARLLLVHAEADVEVDADA